MFFYMSASSCAKIHTSREICFPALAVGTLPCRFRFDNHLTSRSAIPIRHQLISSMHIRPIPSRNKSVHVDQSLLRLCGEGTYRSPKSRTAALPLPIMLGLRLLGLLIRGDKPKPPKTSSLAGASGEPLAGDRAGDAGTDERIRRENSVSYIDIVGEMGRIARSFTGICGCCRYL